MAKTAFTNWIQRGPYQKCHCLRPCYRHACCKESFDRWSRRESRCLRHILRATRREGRLLFYGNANFGSAASPKDVKAVLARFRSGIAKLKVKWRYYLEPTTKDRVHLHFVLIGVKRVSQAAMRNLWTSALGAWHQPRKSSVKFEQVRSGRGVSNYLAANTNKKRRRPLFKRGISVRTCASSKSFFEMPIAKLYQQLCRADSAYALAASDPYILDHPDYEFYIGQADEAFAARKGTATTTQHKSPSTSTKSPSNSTISPSTPIDYFDPHDPFPLLPHSRQQTPEQLEQLMKSIFEKAKKRL